MEIGEEKLKRQGGEIYTIEVTEACQCFQTRFKI